MTAKKHYVFQFGTLNLPTWITPCPSLVATLASGIFFTCPLAVSDSHVSDVPVCPGHLHLTLIQGSFQKTHPTSLRSP